MVFLDISATHERRKTLSELVRKIASNINIPFTVGGGISSVEDVSWLLESGADNVSVNSAAVKRPELIKELADNFGSQCVVVAADARLHPDGEHYVYLVGGRQATEIKLLDLVKQAAELGAG